MGTEGRFHPHSNSSEFKSFRGSDLDGITCIALGEYLPKGKALAIPVLSQQRSAEQEQGLKI